MSKTDEPLALPKIHDRIDTGVGWHVLAGCPFCRLADEVQSHIEAVSMRKRAVPRP